jgi:hypothetical protein
MINRVIVDFVKTYGKAMLISIEPKMTRTDRNNPKSPQVQATDDSGLLKWTVTVSVPVQGFEKVKQENIEITVNAPNRPYNAIPLGHYVIVEGLEMGIMKAEKMGFSVFFSAENIKPAPPERATAGQEASKGSNS